MLCGEGSHLKRKYPSEGTGELMVEFAKGLGFPDSSVGKESAYSAGDLNLIPGLGRSPGEEKGFPLHYSGLKNSVDRIVHGVAKSDFHFHFQVGHSFPSKEQASFNFMAAVTICSDFGDQENQVCHCFHFSPFYLP